MIWIYRLIFLPALLLALPYYLRRMLKRGGYGRGFSQRFGNCPVLEPAAVGVTRIWIQAVSVGEIQAIRPLVESLGQQPDVEIIITTTTSTGYKLAVDTLSRHTVHTGLFPLDFQPFSAKTWNRLKPTTAILMEGELWPEHLHQAHQRKCPVFLVNARLSDRSFRRYRKVRRAALHILKRLTHVLAATQQDADRYLALGARSSQVTVTGSLKFDVDISPRLDTGERESLRHQLGFAPREGGKPPLVLLGSSTWPGEEELLLNVLSRCREHGVDCRLLIVPRHAERRADVAKILASCGHSWHQRSLSPTVEGAVEIHLADTTGELQRLTQAADLAFIGKSLPPNDGGQTPIEAAAIGVPMVYGPAMSNFRQICKSLEQAGAAVACNHAESVATTLLDLINHPDKRLKMATAAQEWHRCNRGAAQRTLDLIAKQSNPPG